MPSSPFPSFPVSGITIPSTPLIIAAHDYCKAHTDDFTLNHCLRSVAFSLVLQKKLPVPADLDVEAVVISILLHDMGWATTKSLLSNEKRFEVDGADIARDFVKTQAQEAPSWDKHRLQLMWDAIALHTNPGIARYKQPEVAFTGFGILADFFGPHLPLPPGAQGITVDEYKEIVGAFPRLNFRKGIVHIFCGMCRDKPEVTIDNFVSDFGKKYGFDGQGAGKDEFAKLCEEKNLLNWLEKGLKTLEEYE